MCSRILIAFSISPTNVSGQPSLFCTPGSLGHLSTLLTIPSPSSSPSGSHLWPAATASGAALGEGDGSIDDGAGGSAAGRATCSVAGPHAESASAAASTPEALALRAGRPSRNTAT